MSKVSDLKTFVFRLLTKEQRQVEALNFTFYIL